MGENLKMMRSMHLDVEQPPSAVFSPSATRNHSQGRLCYINATSAKMPKMLRFVAFCCIE